MAERKLAPRAAERWLPLAVAALHVFLRFVDVYENGDAYYSTKVGQLKPLNYFVKSAYYYVVWPLLMPRNLGTLRCSARSEKREDVCFARPPCVPARRHRVQPAGAADPPPADVIAVGAATAARWSAGVLLANVAVVTCVARTAQRPKTLDGPRRTLDTGVLPTLFQLASCSLNSGCLVAFPLARATRRLGGLCGVARVAYLLFDEAVAAATLGSYVYWCPATPTFFSDLGAKALFGYMWHPFFVPPATAMVAGLTRTFAKTDQILWLPLILIAHVFLHRVPLTPAALRAELRDRHFASVLCHPQIAILGLLFATLAIRIHQAATV